MYFVVDFICMGLLDLRGEQTENYKMKNYCPQWDSNPGSSVYEAKSLSVAILGEISNEHLNIDRVLHECDIRSSKIIWRVFDLNKTFADCKQIMTCIHNKRLID